MIGVYAEGISDMAKEMSDMKKWDMKSFTISDLKSHSDEKDVVVTNYTVTLKGTYDGKDASGTYYAGSVWKMENGNGWPSHSNVNRPRRRKNTAASADFRGQRADSGALLSGVALTSGPAASILKP